MTNRKFSAPYRPTTKYAAQAARRFIAATDVFCKTALFYWLLLAVLRLLFVVSLREYLTTLEPHQFTAAFVTGGRLSWQTACYCAAVGFAPLFLSFYNTSAAKIAAAVNGAVIFCLLTLFAASIPYYEAFNGGFNQMIFVGANEDSWALLVTCAKDYGLVWRLTLTTAATILSWRLLRKFITRNFAFFTATSQKLHHWTAPINNSLRRIILPGAFFLRAALLYGAVTLAQYGGAWGWETEITWENAGVTKDALLNESVTDGAQALYRAAELNRRYLAGTGLNYTADDVRLSAAALSGKAPVYDNLRQYLTKYVAANDNYVGKPQHIFLILAESYANWPLLPKYEQLHIADGVKQIIAADNTAYCPLVLPNGISTVSAVTGIVTGLADANLYLTSNPQKFTAPFATAAAPLMAELGFHTNFWYAGPASWENIKDFVLAEGFDDFYGRGDMGDGEGSVWGINDEYLFRKILRHTTENPAPSFNVILTAANHSPYEVDLKTRGFPAEKVRAALPASRRNDETLLRQLGHFWYADRQIQTFVTSMREQYPDSLFVIVGDHANRYHVSKTPDLYEQYCVPCIITGGLGVTRDLLPADAVGSHIDIMPTITELVAPPGFAYISLGESLVTNKRAVNYLLCAEKNAISSAADLQAAQNLDGEPAAIKNAAAMRDYIAAVRGISFYLARYGENLSSR